MAKPRLLRQRRRLLAVLLGMARTNVRCLEVVNPALSGLLLQIACGIGRIRVLRRSGKTASR
ncbi:MAG TPA: hypothetical protein PLB25_08365 [Rhodoferax sp.]|nr:hypothetical protein [Rhodoferax sp.]